MRVRYDEGVAIHVGPHQLRGGCRLSDSSMSQDQGLCFRS